jgi:hypothetical protein
MPAGVMLTYNPRHLRSWYLTRLATRVSHRRSVRRVPARFLGVMTPILLDAPVAAAPLSSSSVSLMR